MPIDESVSIRVAIRAMPCWTRPEWNAACETFVDDDLPQAIRDFVLAWLAARAKTRRGDEIPKVSANYCQ